MTVSLILCSCHDDRLFSFPPCRDYNSSCRRLIVSLSAHLRIFSNSSGRDYIPRADQLFRRDTCRGSSGEPAGESSESPRPHIAFPIFGLLAPTSPLLHPRFSCPLFHTNFRLLPQEDSITLWRSLCRSPLLSKVQLVLFLNKVGRIVLFNVLARFNIVLFLSLLRLLLYPSLALPLTG